MNWDEIQKYSYRNLILLWCVGLRSISKLLKINVEWNIYYCWNHEHRQTHFTVPWTNTQIKVNKVIRTNTLKCVTRISQRFRKLYLRFYIGLLFFVGLEYLICATITKGPTGMFHTLHKLPLYYWWINKWNLKGHYWWQKGSNMFLNFNIFWTVSPSKNMLHWYYLPPKMVRNRLTITSWVFSIKKNSILTDFCFY